eukprot:TRINITY_DN11855_c0_g1_i1.p1 TRINITY_DN11855_c0_g1~~TRINITY_DN11855_c0_g1_i1.p1  ORF type:complete len:521 (+),score=135.26 TRINITY_DN11855_c0_g1_i1:137-1699(+)
MAAAASASEPLPPPEFGSESPRKGGLMTAGAQRRQGLRTRLQSRASYISVPSFSGYFPFGNATSIASTSCGSSSDSALPDACSQSMSSSSSVRSVVALPATISETATLEEATDVDCDSPSAAAHQQQGGANRTRFSTAAPLGEDGEHSDGFSDSEGEDAVGELRTMPRVSSRRSSKMTGRTSGGSVMSRHSSAVTSVCSAATEYYQDDSVTTEQLEAAQKFAQSTMMRRARFALPGSVPVSVGPPAMPPSKALVVSPLRRVRLEDEVQAAPLLEGLACCAYGRGQASSELSSLERSEVQAIRAACSRTFDEAGGEMQVKDAALRSIWNASIPSERLAAVSDGSQWKRIGFQTTSPRSEVGQSRLTLEMLRYLADTHPTRLRKLVKQANGLRYPLMSCCLSIVAMILVFFDLTDLEASVVSTGLLTPPMLRARHQQLKNFLALCRRSQTKGGSAAVLRELFCMLVCKFHKACVDLWTSEPHVAMEKQLQKALMVAYEANSNFFEDSCTVFADLKAAPEGLD